MSQVFQTEKPSDKLRAIEQVEHDFDVNLSKPRAFINSFSFNNKEYKAILFDPTPSYQPVAPQAPAPEVLFGPEIDAFFLIKNRFIWYDEEDDTLYCGRQGDVHVPLDEYDFDSPQDFEFLKDLFKQQ